MPAADDGVLAAVIGDGSANVARAGMQSDRSRALADALNVNPSIGIGCNDATKEHVVLEVGIVQIQFDLLGNGDIPARNTALCSLPIRSLFRTFI